MSKIKAPGWCSNAVPTARGWEDPVTGELYISSGFTQSQIDEFFGVTEEVVQPKASLLTEAPVGGKSLQEMTKAELEALGRQYGVELDRRLTKAKLVSQIKEII